MCDLLAAWGLTPVQTQPAARGTNNTTTLVRTDTGTYVLRETATLTAIQVQRETWLLDWLEQAGLPFAVPHRLPTRAGRRWMPMPGGIATVSRLIPGHRPGLDDSRSFECFGAAVGALTSALAAMPMQLAPWNWLRPLVPDPGRGGVAGLIAALSSAGVSDAVLRALTAECKRVERDWTELAALPRQVGHADVGASNLLVDGGRVTGMLDFEVAGAELRAEELATALTQTPALDSADWPEYAAALARGFRSTGRLRQDEIDAQPALIRRRAVGSVLWRARSWQAGHSDLDDVSVRIDRLRTTVRWLATHDAELVHMLSAE